MKQRIDAIILAGTKNCPKLKVKNKEPEHKQFMKLGGQPIVSYPIRAALGCKEISRVHVVSDTQKLWKTLDNDLMAHTKLSPVPDKGSYVKNIKDTFYEDVLFNTGTKFEEYDEEEARQRFVRENPEAAEHRVLILYSDTPFITPPDIKRFVETAEHNAPGADAVVGFTHEQAIANLEEEIGPGGKLSLSDPRTKTALFPLGDQMIRYNNMALLKPLKVPVSIWTAVQGFYDARNLLDLEGHTDSTNWRQLKQVAWQYVKSQRWSDIPGVLRGFLNGQSYFNAMLKVRDGKKVDIPTRAQFEDAVYDITAGVSVRGNICDVAHTLMDVDNAEMYARLRANGEELFWKLYNSGRHYSNLPEQELRRWEKEEPERMELEPEEGPARKLFKQTKLQRVYEQKS